MLPPQQLQPPPRGGSGGTCERLNGVWSGVHERGDPTRPGGRGAAPSGPVAELVAEWEADVGGYHREPQLARLKAPGGIPRALAVFSA